VSAPYTGTRAAFLDLLRQRILVLDGAMGTMIQDLKLNEEGYRGARFDAWNREVRGNNDLLNLSRPDAVRDIHLAYFRAGADIVSTNTFSSTTIAQADYGMEGIAYELNHAGATLARARVVSPNLLRTAEPPLASAEGRAVRGVRRIGKRIVVELEGNLFLVIHLMIAGRFHWKEPGARIPGRVGLAAFEFSSGTLILTEAGTKKRASLHVVAGEAAVRSLDPGGIEPLDAPLVAFRAALLRENHTLKRALTDPHIFSGIGNAYSDEILHRARLSPLQLTRKLDEGEIERLWKAVRETLTLWLERLRAETGASFPEKVTAFRPGMAVHGRYKEPCPDCAVTGRGTPIRG